MHAKIFIWLGLWRRCWTADRLARRALPHPTSCPFCDQDLETIDHILMGCVFAREVWFLVLHLLGFSRLEPTPRDTAFQDWWRKAAKRSGREARRGINSLIILVAWLLWKYRNRCVFDGERPRSSVLLKQIKEEINLWVLAGAAKLGRVSQQVVQLGGSLTQPHVIM